MKFPLGLQIRLMRLFRRIKTRFAYVFAIYHYLHNPFSLVRADTKESGLVGFCSLAYVLKVFCARHFAQIFNAVVCFYAIFMVYVLCRPDTGYVKPRQSMRQLFSVVNSYRPVPSRLCGPSYGPNKVFSVMMPYPRKSACVRIVPQRFTEMFYGAGRV